MLLHKQKSLYHLSDDEKSDLMDMILVAINEVTKFNPNESDGSRYDYGIDFSNMPPINPYVVSNVLQDLEYEEGDVDTNGWENDYWQSFTHPDEKKFPPMQMSGTSWIHECHLHGEEDDSFKVSTSDDAMLAISFQMSYRFNPDTLVDTYKKFKGMDGEAIVNSRVKTVLKSKVSEITTDYSMMDIYSGNRSEINNKITEYLNNAFEKEYGIQVLDASIIDVHPDDKLKESIDNRVTALQQKQQAQVEQETAKVQAETALIKAQNEADIKVTAAKAEAEANQLKSASLTPELIQMTEAEARLKHGWVTVQGADATVVDANGK